MRSANVELSLLTSYYTDHPDGHEVMSFVQRHPPEILQEFLRQCEPNHLKYLNLGSFVNGDTGTPARLNVSFI